MTASETTRGTVNRATNVGNPGVLIGTQDVGGQPYARYRATNGTWVSASLQEQGYATLYRPNTGYGAYTGLVRSSDGTPLTNPDRIRPGQEYLVPVLRSTQPPPARPQTNSRTIELFSNAEDSRSTRNRYDAGGQRPQVTGPLKAYAAPLVYPVARAALSELAGETLTGGGAGESLTAGGAAETLTAAGAAEGLTAAGAVITGGVALLAAAALGFAGYEVNRAYREWKSLEQARADARDLLRQAQEGARRLWQNGVITDEEYLLYLATGKLVVQPDGPRPGETGAQYERRIFRDTPLAPASKTYRGWRGGTNGSLTTWWNSVKGRFGADAQKRAKRVLAMSANEFVAKLGSKQLQSSWAERQKIRDKTAKDLAEELKRLSEAPKGSAEHRQASSRVDELTKRQDEINSAESRAMGELRPDQIELFFEEMRALVTDITLKLHDPWHELKSVVYREAVREITGYHVDAIEFRTALQQVLLLSEPKAPEESNAPDAGAPDAGFAPIR
jgi:hypothetical protein